MRRFLRDIKNRFDVPIVLVTHDITEAFTVADTVIIYSNGKVIQMGTPQNILANPLSSDVEMLCNTKELPHINP